MASKPVELRPEESQTCSFCQESNPDRTELALLPCRHRLCAHCLQQLSSASAAVSGANCPSCLAVSEPEVPEVGGNVESLVPKPSDNTSSPPTCANTACEHGPATVFCTDCNKYYCGKCSKNHELFDFLRYHTLRSVGDMSAEDVEEAESSVCQEHGSPRNIWCKKCHHLMCPSCGLFEHKDHLYQKLADSLSDAQRKLDSIIKELEEYMTEQEKNVAELEQTQNDIKSNIQSARKAVEEAAQKFRDIITKHERDLASELDHHETEVLSKLKSVYEESKSKITVARALKQNAKSVIQTKKPADKIEQATTLQEQQYGMTTSQYQKLSWKLSLQQEQQANESLYEPFGRVELKSTRVPPDPSSLGDPLERVALSYDGSRVVCGMIVIDNWLCITHYNSSNLQLYNVKSCQKQTCQVPGLTNPRGMALMNPESVIMITEEVDEGCKLHFAKLSADMKIIDHKVKMAPLQNPRRITLSNSTDKLLIGCYDGSHFLVVNKKGDLVKKVAISSFSADAPYYNPFCVHETKEGYVFLSWIASDSYRLQWGDKHGTIDDEGPHDELLAKPRHFVKSKYEDMIIADSDNNRVLFVEGKKKPSRSLLTSKDGIYSPDCLYLDEEAGRLYVAHGPEGSVEVRVYRWPPVAGEFSTTNFELDVHLSKVQ